WRAWRLRPRPVRSADEFPHLFTPFGGRTVLRMQSPSRHSPVRRRLLVSRPVRHRTDLRGNGSEGASVMGSREMAICGIGAVTGYGWGREALWDGLASGKHAARLEAGYGADGDRMAWVARVPDGGQPSDGPSRFVRAMRAAAREAIADAIERGWQPGSRVGVVHAEVLRDVDQWKDFFHHDRNLLSRDYLAMMP